MKRARGAVKLGCLLFLCLFFVAVAESRKTPPAVPVNLNTANAEQMQKVPGIGPGTAKAILNFREKSGPFSRVEDLLAIRGITERKLNRMRPYIAVSDKNSAKPRSKS